MQTAHARRQKSKSLEAWPLAMAFERLPGFARKRFHPARTCGDEIPDSIPD